VRWGFAQDVENMEVQNDFFEPQARAKGVSDQLSGGRTMKRPKSWWDQLPSLGDQIFVPDNTVVDQGDSPPPGLMSSPTSSKEAMDELSPLRPTKGLRRAKTSSPPPGFGSAASCHPEVTGNDKDTGRNDHSGSDVSPTAVTPPSDARKANHRLKRCVTFGTMPTNRTGSCERGEQDHIALRQMDGVEATLPEDQQNGPGSSSSRLRRVNSSQIMRQAFPKTIFDNVEENPCEGSGSASSSEMESIASSMRAMLKATPTPNMLASEHEYKPVSPDREGALDGDENGRARGDSWYNYQEKSWQRSNETLLEPAPGGPSLVPPSQYPSPAQHSISGWEAAMSGTHQQALPRHHPHTVPMPQQPAMPYPMPPFVMPAPQHGAQAGQPPYLSQQQQYLQWMYWSQMMNAAALAHGHAMPFPQAMPAPTMPGAAMPRGHTGNRQQRRGGGSGRGGGRWGKGGGRGGGQSESYGSHSATPQQRQSSLLMDHKATGRRVELAELAGHVVEFARDSHGSRFLQYKMETADDIGRQMLFDEVLPVAVELMNDVFGNYVIQNFLEHGALEQCRDLICTMRGHLLDLATQMHGCRVVQKALQVACPSQRAQLVAELMPHAGHCARDPHATHVMQRLVGVVDSEQRAQLERATDAELIDLSVHPHACRFVQRVLGSIDIRRPLISAMMKTIETNYQLLSLDQHGNFILQHILDHGQPKQSAAVQRFVCEHVVSFSQHKFASHLVEKCLMSATTQQRHALISAMLGSLQERDGELEDTVLALMKDPYANFVVQKAYDVAEGRQRSAFSRGVLRHADKLNRFTYGRHILSHISKSSPVGSNSSRSPTMPS